jgi:hypothetical protein
MLTRPKELPADLAMLQQVALNADVRYADALQRKREADNEVGSAECSAMNAWNEYHKALLERVKFRTSALYRSDLGPKLDPELRPKAVG